MKGKSLILFCLVSLGLLLASCVPSPPPQLTPPPFPLENLPPVMTAAMELKERMVAEEAWGYLRRGDLAATEKVLARLSPLSPSYHLLHGLAQLMRGENNAAVESFKLIQGEFPRLALLHAGLAQAYLNLGNKEAAFNEFREVLKEEPDNSWARKEFNNLKEKLTSELRRASEQAMKAGQVSAAKEALLQALHYSPEAVDLHLSLAQIYRQEKDEAGALTHLKAAVDLAPHDRSLLRQYASLLIEAKHYSRALDLLEELLELNPKDKEVQNQLAELKEKLGIVELPSQYEAIPRLEAITREDLASLIAEKFKSFLGPITDSPEIIVDIATSWAAKFIVQVTSLGLLEVYPDHSFRPKAIITRGEMADAVARLVHFLEKKGKRFFPQLPADKIVVLDVTPEHAFYTSIIEVLSYQLMDLSAQKQFNPDKPVSGMEAVKILDVLLALVK